MKFLRFNFCHPVKGRASLIQLLAKPRNLRTISIDSKNSNLVEIPVKDLQEGKWKVILEWEKDDKIFTHQKEFEIINRDAHFKL